MSAALFCGNGINGCDSLLMDACAAIVLMGSAVTIPGKAANNMLNNRPSVLMIRIIEITMFDCANYRTISGDTAVYNQAMYTGQDLAG